MKIVLTIELDIPDNIPTIKGFEDQCRREWIYEGYVQYVTNKHLEDAVEYCARARVGSNNEDNDLKEIFKYHAAWGKVARSAKWSFKII